MTKLILTAVALVGAASNAYAGFTTPGWGCLNCGYKNGVSLNGLGRNGLQLEGVAVDQAAADQVVSAIVLPSGEIVSVGGTHDAPVVLAKKPKPKPRPNYDDVVRDNTVTDSEYWQIH